MGLLDQFFGNFSMLKNVPGLAKPAQAQGAQSGGAQAIVDAITKRITGGGQPQQPQNNGANDVAAIIKAYQGDPLGEVARSNSRPSGFTPQAAWDSWGPSARKAGPTPDALTALRMGGGGGSVKGQAFDGPYGSGSVSQAQPQTVVPAGPPAPVQPQIPQNTVPSGRPDGPQQPQMPQGPMDVFNSFLTATPTPPPTWTDQVAPMYGATRGPEGWSAPGPEPTPSLPVPTPTNPMDAFLNPMPLTPPATGPTSGNAFLDRSAQDRGASWDAAAGGWSAPGPEGTPPAVPQVYTPPVQYPPGPGTMADGQAIAQAQARANSWNPHAGGWKQTAPQPDPAQLLAMLAQAFGMPAMRPVQ